MTLGAAVGLTGSQAAALGAAGLGAAGAIGGGLISSSGARSAANTSTAAQRQQVALSAPFVGYGQQAGQTLSNALASGALGAPAPLDEASIANFPGYQFALHQGLLGVQNQLSPQGLSTSGPALKAAAAYATGLAAQNFQNYFQDYWANQTNRYNMLANTMNTGANTSVGAGSNIGNTAAQIGGAQQNAANLLGAGTQGGLNSAALAALLMGRGGGSTTGLDPTIAAAQNTSPYPGTFYGVPT